MTKRELELNLEEINKKLDILTRAVSVPLSDKTTYGEWIEEWYSLYKLPNLKPSTLITYRDYLDRLILPSLGGIRLTALSAADLQRFLNAIPRDNTRRKVGVLLNNSLLKAVKAQKIKFNPYDCVEIPAHHVEHYKPLEFDIQDMLLKNIANEKYARVYTFMCCTGLRISEFLALDFTDDVDRETRLIYIRASKTASGVRTVEYAPPLDECVQYLATYRLSGGTFTYTSVRLFFKRLYEKHDLKGYNLHTFRHTFVSLCYAAGMREKYIQQLVGHSKIDVTLNVYTHVLKPGTSHFFDYVKKLAATL